MRYFNLLVGIIWLSLSCSGVHANNVFWFQPGVAITKFQATMIVPAMSKGTGSHGVWPGIETDSGGWVFQTVVSDSKVPGSWQLFVEYCCNPDYQASPVKVYPGDSITSTFTRGSNGFWTDSWSLSPGSTGAANGQKAQTGSSSNSFIPDGVINKAALAIEVQNGGSWDFGQVQWSSISITASTTKSWCSTGYSTSGGFTASVSGGTGTVSGSSITCTYNRVTFG